MTQDAFELWSQPVYQRGDAVTSLRDVRNDGTYPGTHMGEVLIRKGEAGYIHSVGTYLNRFYIYGVEFMDSGRLVGMRAHELEGRLS
ncbi:Putative NifZ protein (fragment) [Candidatus Terasakiella magnetica]